jgi:hypothetical protein
MVPGRRKTRRRRRRRKGRKGSSILAQGDAQTKQALE